MFSLHTLRGSRANNCGHLQCRPGDSHDARKCLLDSVLCQSSALRVRSLLRIVVHLLIPYQVRLRVFTAGARGSSAEKILVRSLVPKSTSEDRNSRHQTPPSRFRLPFLIIRYSHKCDRRPTEITRTDGIKLHFCLYTTISTSFSSLLRRHYLQMFVSLKAAASSSTPVVRVRSLLYSNS